MINPKPKPQPTFTRRYLLQAGLAGLGVSATVAAIHQLGKQKSFLPVKVPPIPEYADKETNPMLALRNFDYGTSKSENGRKVKEFRLTAQNKTLELNSAVSFNTWNFNGKVPGPTLRVREGDRVRVIFSNQGGHSHSVHFHGIHPAEMDGVKPIRHGEETVYEFDAKPFGVHLYHCHTEPITRHIGKGLYGMFIIDPPQPRPPADEIVLVMGGYDTNDDQINELYAFNGIPNYYMHHPIPIYQNQLVRLYVLNLIEFDPAATFHLHGNMFQIYRSGRTLIPSEEADVITMGTAERHILEFSYPYLGKYMFHPHQDAIAQHGCMGLWDVIASS